LRRISQIITEHAKKNLKTLPRLDLREVVGGAWMADFRPAHPFQEDPFRRAMGDSRRLDRGRSE
jgi:hypothetical protein